MDFFYLKRKQESGVRVAEIDEEIQEFFKDHCLLTTSIKLQFEIILKEILHDQNFWQNEFLFEPVYWPAGEEYKLASSKQYLVQFL